MHITCRHSPVYNMKILLIKNNNKIYKIKYIFFPYILYILYFFSLLKVLNIISDAFRNYKSEIHVYYLVNGFM